MAEIVELDSKRIKQWEHLICGFCAKTGWRMVIPGRQYYPCPAEDGCEEIASQPVWKVGQR